MLALLKRDVKLAFSQGGGLGAAFGFILSVLVLIPLSVGPDQALLHRLAPGMMWVSLLLAVLLTADRIFQQDFEDGSLDLLTMGTQPFELVVLVKALAHWITVSLPLALVAPPLGLVLNLSGSEIPLLLLSMVIGSLALSMLASIGGAVTAGLRRGGLLVSLLVLPLYVPVLIFGVGANDTSVDAGHSSAALLILCAITLFSCVLAPWACAAALRAYLR